MNQVEYDGQVLDIVGSEVPAGKLQFSLSIISLNG